MGLKRFKRVSNLNLKVRCYTTCSRRYIMKQICRQRRGHNLSNPKRPIATDNIPPLKGKLKARPKTTAAENIIGEFDS
jgi:hypothetical protein